MEHAMTELVAVPGPAVQEESHLHVLVEIALAEYPNGIEA